MQGRITTKFGAFYGNIFLTSALLIGTIMTGNSKFPHKKLELLSQIKRFFSYSKAWSNRTFDDRGLWTFWTALAQQQTAIVLRQNLRIEFLQSRQASTSAFEWTITTAFSKTTRLWAETPKISCMAGKGEQESSDWFETSSFFASLTHVFLVNRSDFKRAQGFPAQSIYSRLLGFCVLRPKCFLF